MMAHPLDGVRERLARVDEHISNLDREIQTFLKTGFAPFGTYDTQQALEEALKSHTERIVPMRISILSGEIVHHLRTCLDHIAWQLTSDARRESAPDKIMFPILLNEPRDKNTIERNARKLEGISSQGQALIERMQPYKRQPAILTGPDSDPLWIISQMDNIDKHRELLLTVGGFAIQAHWEANIHLLLQRYADRSELDIASLSRTFDPKSKITPAVAFAQFGGRRIQPVIPGLIKLTKYVRNVTEASARECF